jgi:hypothetical protein
MALVSDYKVVFFFLILVLLGLLAFFFFKVSNGGGWELADASITRLCVVNEGVCTGM